MAKPIKKSSNRALINPTSLTSSKSFYVLMALSTPFLSVGIWIVGSSLGAFPLDQQKLNISVEIFLLVGIVFTLAGGYSFLIAGVNLFKLIQKKKYRFRYPNEPWNWDFSWHSKGHGHSFLKELGYNLFGLILILGLFLPGIYIALFKNEAPLVFQIIILLFSVLFVILAIHEICKTIKFGNVKCNYTCFPYRLGERVTFNIDGLPESGKINQLTCLLKCFKFKLVERSSGGKRSFQRESLEIYKQEIEVNKNHIINKSLTVTTKTPADPSLSTDFVSEDHICWELSVHADIPGIDYHYGFIIPIYK